MISIKDLYNVLAAMVPLYVAMILAYGSVRWWKIFTSVQCSGINRFVAVFAVPLLSFHFISNNNPYQMDGKFILADTISKLLVFTVLVIWCRFASNGSLDWLITLFSVATLPNTLVMGIPLLDSMYGHFYGGLMVQLVVLQCIIWYTLLLFLFEYRAARALVMEQFPDTAASIISFKVDTDVVSLDGREPIQTQAEVRDDGKIKVTIRRSTSSRSHAFSSFPSPRSLGLASMPSSKAITPRPSNMTGAEIYSIHSSRINTPKDVNSLMSTRAVSPRQSNFTASDIYSVQSSRGPTPRVSNVNEENYREIHGVTRGPNSHFKSQAAPNGFSINPLPGAYSSASNGKIPQIGKRIPEPKASPRLEDDGKELHMFVWSSTASPVSDGGLHVFGGTDFGLADTANAVNEPKEVRMHIRSCSDQTPNGDAHEARRPSPAPHVTSTDEFSFRSKANLHGQEETLQGENEKSRLSVSKSPKDPMIDHKPKEMPPTSVMVKLILQMVGRKLIRNPNTYSSLIGLAWALISYRWNIVMPKIITGSIKILSDAGLGLAMFSLGLFMALQPRLIACGTSIAAFAMAVRFLTGPAVMAASSAAVGLRGIDLHAAIVQAALPQGIVPFVFAREYDLHPDILSTAVIFGMLIALPITLLYYVFLGL